MLHLIIMKTIKEGDLKALKDKFSKEENIKKSIDDKLKSINKPVKK